MQITGVCVCVCTCLYRIKYSVSCKGFGPAQNMKSSVHLFVHDGSNLLLCIFSLSFPTPFFDSLLPPSSSAVQGTGKSAYSRCTNIVGQVSEAIRFPVSRGKDLGRGGARRFHKVCAQAPYAGVDNNIRSIIKPIIGRLA